MENFGVIKRIEGEQVFVEVDPVVSGCGRCHEAGGCGSSLLTQSLRPAKFRLYRLPNCIGASVGDHVILSVPEGAVLRASLLAYLMPILLLIGGAALGMALDGQDSAALSGAGIGLLLGLLGLRMQHRLVPPGSASVLLSMRFDDGRGVRCRSQMD